MLLTPSIKLANLARNSKVLQRFIMFGYLINSCDWGILISINFIGLYILNVEFQTRRACWGKGQQALRGTLFLKQLFYANWFLNVAFILKFFSRF
jgi:hypothetical protein